MKRIRCSCGYDHSDAWKAASILSGIVLGILAADCIFNPNDTCVARLFGALGV